MIASNLEGEATGIKIVGAGKNACFGSSFPTQEFTIDIGPRDEDGIRTVRIIADAHRGSRSAGRANQKNHAGGADRSGAPAARLQTHKKEIP